MFPRRTTPKYHHCALAAFAAAIFAGLPASAAVYNWDNLTGNWNTGANWTPDGVPLSSETTELVFGGTATPYTATHNLGTPFVLNILRLQNNIAGVTQTLSADVSSTLDFAANGLTNPTLVKTGAGDFSIDIPLVLNSTTTMQATGNGLVTFLGSINGFSDLAFSGGNWLLRDINSSFSGAVTISTGARVELKDEAVAPTNLLFAGGGNGVLGSGTNVNLNGGTLKLSTQGTGNIQLGSNRIISGGTDGGTLDITNSNPGSSGGNIAGGDLAVTTTDGATVPLVIKFNGGELGISNITGTNPATPAGPGNGDWRTGDNTLRMRSYSGTGPLRVELTNGALYRPTFGSGTLSISMPTTVRGVVGGDPTSGAEATNPSGVSRTTGRFGIDNLSVLNYTSGLNLEGALQIALVGATRALDGNVTVNGSAGGAPGYVTFSGRSTGTSLANGTVGSVINNPGANTAGQNVLWLGQGRNDLLTIQDGGVAVMDLRVRSEQGNHNGVLLDANTQIDAGGVLRFSQSLSNSNAAQGGVTGANTNASAGNHIVRGDLRGSGTTAKESVIELYLPAANEIPATISPAISLGGVAFDTAAGSSANLVVNGTGFGGLKVNALARPSALLGGAPDPVTNAAKLNNLLTSSRVAGLTGSGGYLTAAAAGEAYAFPNAEWAPGVPVGLRVSNSNSNGIDVQMSAATWGHNLAVDAGAELSLGANPFTLSAGTLHGSGTVSGAGGLTIAAPATVAPGLNGIGTLTLGNVTIGGTLLADFANANADQISVGGNLSLAPTSILQIAPGSTFAGSYTLLAYSGTLTGTFGTITGLPVGYTVNYTTPGAVRMVLSTVQTLTWNGAPGSVWSTSPTDANWQGGKAFNNGDVVSFNDTAAGSTTVTVTGNVEPGQVTFDNSTKSYTISGAGSIIGPALLTKSGTGTLTINGSHNYGGGTVISGGTFTLGNDEALPNAGAVTVAAGGTLNVNGKTDTIGNLTVTGSVTAGNLTVAQLTIQDGATIASNLKLNGNAAKNGTAPVTLSGNIDLNNASRTFTVATGTGTDLTLTGTVSNGTLVKAGPGVLSLNKANTYAGGTTVNAGTLVAGVAGGVPSGAVTVNGGTLNLNAFPLIATALTGTGGSIALGGATLTINNAATGSYAGVISGTGAVVKQGDGTQTLSGANTFDGGLTISTGRVNVANAAAAGTGVVNVAAAAGLQFNTAITNNVNVNGGSISGAGPANLTSGELNITAPSTVLLFNRDSNANSEMIFTGTLRGTGNITVTPGTGQANADQGAALRLRGTTPSDYSGTLTAQQRVKFEIQMADSAAPNPFGTGKVILTGGTSTGELQGTYAQMQPRLAAASQTYPLNNDVEVSGPGYVNINVLGGAEVIAQFKSLRIGDGQILAANKNDLTNRSVEFTTVTHTGGTAEFRAFDPGFAVATNANKGGSNIRLGTINELTPNSGVIFKSTAPFVNEIVGEAKYTGLTQVASGTLRVALGGSIAATSEIRVEGGAIFDVLQQTPGYTIRAAQKLTGTGDWDGRIIATGTLSPGVDGIGTITGDDLTLNGNAPLPFQLSTADNTSDRITLLGAFDKGSAGQFRFDFQGGGRAGQTYTLLQFASTTFTAGDFSYVNLAPTLTATFLATPNELRLVVIPEPGAAVSILAGLGALLGIQRRRQLVR
jgi:autotransporter-associated beta strand protein